ncbi:phage tail protein [Exiguobacterium sp. MMG028]|uniref:phage tail protein n=1 Tax=Exiguobacterium TaxID=33986 RepID=UPI000691EFB1|nr:MULTISPECIES: phage tail protein [Exiguobacterium]MDA5559198.1 phage tail protein [Exiguobacterium sp. MMG028]
MKIGTFAGVSFEVSAQKVLTFDALSRSGSSRWAVHDIALQKPLPEFLGAGQESISMKISLHRSKKVNPEKVAEQLRKFRDSGKVSTLVIGKKPVTNGFWYIEDLQEDHRRIDNKGISSRIDLTLSLKEYPKDKPIRLKPKAKKKTSTSMASSAKRKGPIGTATVKVGMLNCRMGPSLNARIKKVLRRGQRVQVYGYKTGSGLTWFNVGAGLYISAVSKYTTFKKK